MPYIEYLKVINQTSKLSSKIYSWQIKCTPCKYTFHKPGLTCRILRLFGAARRGPTSGLPLCTPQSWLPSPGLLGSLHTPVWASYPTRPVSVQDLPVKSRGATYDLVCLQGDTPGEGASVCPGSGPGPEYQWGYTSVWPWELLMGRSVAEGRAEQRSPKVWDLVSLGFCN